MTISGSEDLLSDFEAIDPDFVMVAHGITEAIVRPTAAALRLVPSRWRMPGWLDPRPYFSRRMYKRCYQQLESAIRWRVKVILIKYRGGGTWMTLEEFDRRLTEFVRQLLDHTSARVLYSFPTARSMSAIFPGSPASLNAYQAIVRQLHERLKKKGRLYYCDVTRSCHLWDDFFVDHFHPNAKGHEKIAKAIFDLISPIGGVGS